MSNKIDFIHIAICLDDNYFEPAVLLLKSIIHTNSENNLSFHILFETLSETHKQLFECLTSDYVKISLYNLNTEILNSCKITIKKNDHVSLATYFRLLLPNILSKNISKIIYLDCDMLCFDSLKELYDTDIAGFAFAASYDSQCKNEARKSIIGLKNESDYFGAGMLLINLDYWRDNNVSEKCLKYIEKNAAKLKWHDQDTLNAVLKNNILPVNFRYNFYETFFKIREKSVVSEEQWYAIQEAKKNICILHYTQAEKPWYFECEHPLKDVWRNYYKKTFHKNTKLTFKYTGKSKISFIKRKILSKLFRFPMNKNYEIFPLSLKNEIYRKLELIF